MATNVMQELEKKAKANPKRVVLPESEEPKILQAARAVLDRGLGKPVLVGAPDAVRAAAAAAGVSLDGMELVDSTDAAKIDQLVAGYTAQCSDLPASSVKRMLRKPLNVGALLLRLGEVDCLVAGLAHTTGDVILSCQMLVGMQEGIATPSSMGIMAVPGYQGPEGELLAIADCAVCAAPDPSELADIAIATADTTRSLLGWEPRVALLSFSTKGSATHDKVDDVLKTLELVRERRPDILIDGELQLDSAIVPEVAAKKLKEPSAVAGRANVLIFPDLNAGNIGVKLVQRFAGGVGYGPLLQGFVKPVSDLSRGAPVEEIVGAVVMTVARAG
ncbi:MAG: phosphate acetyltransferase [Deltaproteobacteria bacterium]|nr:phosphate acetyltransferase [Deltaproteobacteria bacterium]